MRSEVRVRLCNGDVKTLGSETMHQVHDYCLFVLGSRPELCLTHNNGDEHELIRLVHSLDTT